jgi:hypothetical protein
MIEASRRHGPFDLRFQLRDPLAAAAAAPDAAVPESLDWEAFSALSFPGRKRHDLQAIKAYAAYRNGGSVLRFADKSAESDAESEGMPPRAESPRQATRSGDPQGPRRSALAPS